MNNSRNEVSIISLGNLCQAPFLCQDCNQLLQKVRRTTIPFMAYIFLNSKIIPRLQDCTTRLFSTISRTNTYHQGTPDFSEMDKCCHNTDKKHKLTTIQWYLCLHTIMKQIAVPASSQNNKWFPHPSHHRYIHWVWVGFATYFISIRMQWSCKRQHWAHQNASAVEIRLKSWYKSNFSFHQNIQDDFSYLCYILFLTCERWQVLKGKYYTVLFCVAIRLSKFPPGTDIYILIGLFFKFYLLFFWLVNPCLTSSGKCKVS